MATSFEDFVPKPRDLSLVDGYKLVGLSDREAALLLDSEVQKVFSLGYALLLRRNLLLPIHRLPGEVLAQIFSQVRRKTPKRWFLVSHVCHYWYNVAVGHPKLWGTVIANTLHQARTFIHRSKAVDVRVELVRRHQADIPSVELKAYLALFVQHSDRIIHLHISVGRRSMQTILDTSSFSLEKLSSLTLSHERPIPSSGLVDWPNPSTLEPLAKDRFFDNITPNLSSLVLNGINPPWGSRNFTKLTSLRLHHLNTWWMSAIKSLSMDTFLNFLEGCQALRDISLTHSGPMASTSPDTPSTRRIQLPCLSEICLRNDAGNISFLLSYLQLADTVHTNLAILASADYVSFQATSTDTIQIIAYVGSQIGPDGALLVPTRSSLHISILAVGEDDEEVESDVGTESEEDEMEWCDLVSDMLHETPQMFSHARVRCLCITSALDLRKVEEWNLPILHFPALEHLALKGFKRHRIKVRSIQTLLGTLCSSSVDTVTDFPLLKHLELTHFDINNLIFAQMQHLRRLSLQTLTFNSPSWKAGEAGEFIGWGILQPCARRVCHPKYPLRVAHANPSATDHSKDSSLFDSEAAVGLEGQQ